MKTVIHQALGYVLGSDTLERAQVEDAFVRDEVVILIKREKIFLKPLKNIVNRLQLN